jgi:uncharacterized membrane protein/uncharacterized lipoprotein YbaY
MVSFAALVGCGSGEAPSPDATAESDASPEARALSIAGEMYYLERIALAPDSLSIVEVRAGSGSDAPLLAKATEPLGTQQVPIGFELKIDAATVETAEELVFRAGIVSSPGPLRVTQALSIEPTDENVNLGQLRVHPADQIAFGTPYQCGDRSIVFGSLGQNDWLLAGDEVFALTLQTSASGARYVAADETGTEFWSKGEEATVTVRGETLPSCARVTEPGLPFVARGQEPGWSLSIDSEAIDLRAYYGEERLNFPRVEPAISAAGLRYETQTEDHRLVVLVDRQACSDTMADLVYPYRVRYTLDGDVQLGCGGDPTAMLMDGEWRIERIGGQEIVPGTQPTIAFFAEDGEYRFAGLASCNRYMGAFSMTGEGLKLTPGASTLMACIDESQALQERRLMMLLAEVYGFGLDEQGRLLLRTGGGDIIASR